MNKDGFHIEKLGLGEHEDINPLIPIIEDLFANELHESNWLKYDLTKATELLKEKIKAKGIKSTESHYQSLNRKIKKCGGILDLLTLLTDTMFPPLKESK